MNSYDYNNYHLFKLNEMILVEDNMCDIIKDSPDFCNILFLKQFLSFVEKLASGNILAGDMRRNVLNYINSILDMEFDNETKEDRLERLDLVNKIIRTLNKQTKDESINFFRLEMYKRTNCKRYLNSFKVSDSQILKDKDALFASIKLEQVIIYTHSSEVSDEDFVDKYLFEIVDNDIYYGAINCMLMEYPEVFLDKTFYDRFSSVMDVNLAVSKNIIMKKGIKTFKKTVIRKRKKLSKNENNF